MFMATAGLKYFYTFHFSAIIQRRNNEMKHILTTWTYFENIVGETGARRDT